MAVTVVGDIIPDIGGKPGNYRLLWGTVTLDGTNPTPVDLATYVQSLDLGVANIEGSSALADDPNQISTAISAAVLNIYAWKNTSGTDPTYTASGDSSRVINWFAIGPTL